MINTHPNPALLIPRSPPPHLEHAPRGAMYNPAWMLEDESLERAGRGDPPN